MAREEIPLLERTKSMRSKKTNRRLALVVLFLFAGVGALIGTLVLVSNRLDVMHGNLSAMVDATLDMQSKVSQMNFALQDMYNVTVDVRKNGDASLRDLNQTLLATNALVGVTDSLLEAIVRIVHNTYAICKFEHPFTKDPVCLDQPAVNASAVQQPAADSASAGQAKL